MIARRLERMLGRRLERTLRRLERTLGRRLERTFALLVVLSACFGFGGVAGGLVPLASAAPVRASLPNIEPQVMCVTCKIPLNTAESPQADDERSFIKELISRGKTEPQIKRELVAEYGPAVLALPSAKGFDLAAYLVPAGVGVLVLAILAVLLRRWLKASREDDDVEAPPTLGAAELERLRRDMARFR